MFFGDFWWEKSYIIVELWGLYYYEVGVNCNFFDLVNFVFCYVGMVVILYFNGVWFVGEIVNGIIFEFLDEVLLVVFDL